MATKMCWAAAATIAILSAAPSLVGGRAFGAGQPSADAAAEAHIKKGLELRRKGRDADALAEFEEAMKSSPSARAKAQVGFAQMAVGLFEAAELSLSDVITNSSDDSWVSAHRTALSDALTKIRNHLGTFNASGEPRGATVELNGKAVGALPCSVHVQVGDVVVKVLAPGFLPITRTVSVEPRAISNQVFTLVKASPDKAEDGTTDATPVKTIGGKVTPEEPVAQPSPTNGSPPSGSPATSPASVWPWIAAGGSLLAVSFGTYEAFRWSSKASDFNNMKDAAGNPLCGTGASSAGGETCASLLSAGHTARDLAIGGIALGAALGVTSAILFVRDTPGDSRQALSCVPVPGTAPTVVCSARF